MLKKGVFAVAIGLHLLIIVLYNVNHTFQSYDAVYSTQASRIEECYLCRSIERALQWAPLSYYAYLSGSETGYGFFAPQVGSQYISYFTVMDAEGGLIGQYSMPSLEKQESVLRYAGFLDLLQVLLDDSASPSNTLGQRYARAIIHSIGERLGQQYGGKEIQCKVYVYQHGLLRQQTGHEPALLFLFSKTLHL